MLASLLLLTLNFLGTWYLETTLTHYYKFEFLVLGALLLFAIWLIMAEAKKVRTTWRVSTVYYSLSILNLTFLFLVTGHFFVFGLTTLIALLGLLRSVGRIDELPLVTPPRPVKLETYHEPNDVLDVDPVMWVHPDELVSGSVRPSRVKASSRKSTARKSTRKKSARRSSKKKSVKKTSRKKSSRKKSSRKKSSRKSASRKKSSRRR